MPEPAVYGLAPGVDFPRALAEGLLARMAGHAPDALARTVLIVNSARMERRVRQVFDTGPPLLLPTIRLVTDLDTLLPFLPPPPAIPPLRRRLELATLISKLMDQDTTLARASLYDLADSLAALMDEMQGEGVPPEAIASLDVSDESGHWQRAQRFIAIAVVYLERIGELPDKEARQRGVVDRLAAQWEMAPPDHPVIVAGSTGSRGTTLRLMEAVARLPLGALVLPGFDFDQPPGVWEALRDPLVSEDHPQFRFARFLGQFRMKASDVRPWTQAVPPSPARNRLISLSLRPAPVTDAWIEEGPRLADLAAATADMTLLEAPTPRIEALCIALRLRAAAEAGERAALITPDRALARQVTAALDQWDILPDDSAGTPLHLSPPGRLLRHVAGLFRQRLDAEALLSLLKHPLCHAGAARDLHLRHTQRLERLIRARGLPYPDATGLEQLMRREEAAPGAEAWVAWIGAAACSVGPAKPRTLTDWVTWHRRLTEALVAGSARGTSDPLWDKKAGHDALQVMETLAAQSGFGGTMTAAEYGDLVGALLAEGEVRDSDAPHPQIMIWGTLEARVQGADIVILAGLNEGTWPEAPAPDPWLNRRLRHAAGLLLPERRIGLSAHDFQQAVAAREVWISRSVRSDEAETVAARWVNRLQNLLGGLEAIGGADCLKAMIARGDRWLAMARAFEAVERVPPAPRPSPQPPAADRPTHLSVTEIETLIRDPYAIYARHTLGLRKMRPLVQTADALLRGTLAHDILEGFVKGYLVEPAALSVESFRRIAHIRLEEDVPWPAARLLLRARFDKLADWYVEAEAARLQAGRPVALEADAVGTLTWAAHGLSLTARADRIDATTGGAFILYDYKSGTPPTKKQQAHFNKQLLIEAAMLERGGFANVGPGKVAGAYFIGLKKPEDVVAAPLDEEPGAETLAKLEALLAAYLDPDQGYTARRAYEMDRFENDYDLLSRFGEWDSTAVAQKIRLP